MFRWSCDLNINSQICCHFNKLCYDIN